MSSHRAGPGWLLVMKLAPTHAVDWDRRKVVAWSDGSVQLVFCHSES